VREARQAPRHRRRRWCLAVEQRLALVALDRRERRVERADPSASEPHEPVGEIERVRTLGGAPVVITPQECCGELAGGLRVLERQLAAGGCQQVVRELSASGFQIGELRRALERLKIGAKGSHLQAFDAIFQLPLRGP
jgi:hypothetical protein